MHLTTLLLATLLFLPACAQLSPIVRIEPSPITSSVNVANSPALSLTVQDNRTDKNIGILPSRPEEKPITVTPSVPLHDVLMQKVKESLTTAGFQISSTPVEGTANLVLDIERFNFTKTSPKGDLEMTAYGKIVATAKNGEKTLTKTYATETGKKFPFGLSQDGLQSFLNDALTDGLKALLADDTLLQFLAQGNNN